MLLLHVRDRTEQQRLDMMRVDFVANASHELRTPLASVLGFIETLQGPARDDAAARERFLDIMRQQAQRMSRLIDDLLSLSRVEMAEHRRPENARRPRRHRRADDRHAASARRRAPCRAALRCARRADAGPRDRDDLARVAENLVENAIKYGQSGGRVDVCVAAGVDQQVAPPSC